MIKFVIFDAMGVIFSVGDDVENLLIPYIRALIPAIDAQSVKNSYLAASLGKIHSHKFWELLGFDQANIPAIERDSLGAHPSECVFIDDYPERVEAARELGISSILFDREGHNYNGMRVKSFEQLAQLLT
jgi:FMN phosphatase YigB (HAD superfamily)